MALILRNGLETNSDFQDRLAFIINHRGLWTAGWLTWTAAATAILYFYIVFSSTHRAGKLAVILTVAAIAADLSGQVIEVGVLPSITDRIDLFTAFHRTAVMLSGCIGNGLYSVSALILAWAARAAYPRWVWAAGLMTGCIGLVLSIAVIANSTAGMFWSNVILVPCLLLWLVGVASR